MDRPDGPFLLGVAVLVKVDSVHCPICSVDRQTSDQPVIDREADRRAAGVDADLAVDIPQVRVHGHGGDDELLRNPGVGEPFRHQAEHFDLPLGEASEVGDGQNTTRVLSAMSNRRTSVGPMRP